MRARTAFALVSLSTLNALGQPRPRVVTFSDPPFSLTIPLGFERFDAERPSESLLGCFRRFTHGASRAPTVLLLARMGEEVPQRTLRASELDALRRSDPSDFRFTDHRVKVFALGFELEGLQGEVREGVTRAVRFATAVPLEGPSGVDSVLVTVLAPAERRDEGERVFRAALGAMRGKSAWRTPSQKLRAALQQASGVMAVSLTLGYLLGALVLWRGRPSGLGLRSAALALGSLSWTVYSLCFVLAATERQWVFAVQSMLMALALGWQSRVVARAAR